MNKEVICDKQRIALIILFIIGPPTVSLSGVEAKQDIWLAVIFSMIMGLPMMFIYCRLHNTFPNKDLFDIIEICFGKFIGKVIIIFFTIHFIITVTTILRNYGEFITTVSFMKTPLIIPMICFGSLCAYVIIGGIEALERWGSIFIQIVVFFTFILILLLIPNMNINNIRPVLSNGIKPVLQGASKLYSFPFSQLVVFSTIFSSFKRKISPYRIYFLGLLIGGIIIFVTFFSVLLTVGIEDISGLYYPTYTAVSRIDITGLERTEILSGILFSLGGFVKMSIHLLAICIGIAKIFRITDYRLIVIPITLMTINLSYLLWDSTMDFYEFDGEIMIYFAFPFRTILPILTFIIVEIKKKQNGSVQA
ncbi:GerAB/ArcD/ProY family transporter [Anaeromicrobium sediminis]|uniref:GerAB/ArcD/ProY family transporter n=1 Tax=Anaeromicrobium sediminis TaxID=1478221 RepID=UPI0015959932|nr:endospore germination permease [Anaeromicrobium sediminis]